MTEIPPVDSLPLSDALVQGLVRLGVRHVFGVSGANIEHLHDALHRAKDAIASIMARSEDGAAYMADGYARVHRRLGVCCSTSGGGMLNLVAGIAESYAESVPVLAIVGQPPTTLEGRGGFQDSSGRGRAVDALKLFEAVTKYRAKIERAEDFWPCFTAAVQAALTGRQGPAVLLVPRDLYECRVSGVPDSFELPGRSLVAPAPWLVERLLDELRKSSNPVMLIGHGVRRSTSPASMIEFARRTHIAVATTMAARGDYPNDLSNYLGSVGVAGHPSAHAYIRDQADFLVVVGSGLNIMTRGAFGGDAAAIAQKRLAAINLDLGELRRAYALEAAGPDECIARPEKVLELEYDAGLVFDALLDQHERRPFRFAPHRRERTVVTPVAAPSPPKVVQPAPRAEEFGQPSSLRQSEALRLIGEFVPPGGHLVYDAGNCAAAALHYVQVPPKATTTIALGMGGMGYAIAAAIGISLGCAARRRTIVFTGDGSFLMKGLEIHVAVDHQLPILWIVFNNGMHGMCAMRQRMFFESRYECVQYAPIDVEQVCRGLGHPDLLWVGKARSVADLDACLAHYAAHRGPGVLELCIESEELPPFTPFMTGDDPVLAASAFEFELER